MRPIRKISVGLDYKDAMHYIVDNKCISNTHTICDIKNTEPGVYQVWIVNDSMEIQLWKEIVNQPVTIEYHIILD